MKFDAKNTISSKKIILYTGASAEYLNYVLNISKHIVNIDYVCLRGIKKEGWLVNKEEISEEEIFKFENPLVLIALQDLNNINKTAKLFRQKNVLYDHIDNYGNDISLKTLNALEIHDYIDYAGNHIKFESISGKGNIIVAKRGKKAIGNDVTIKNISANSLVSICFFGENARVKFGNSSFAQGAIMASTNGIIEIGDDCMLSHDIEISQVDQHLIFDLTTQKRININKNIHIGNHVWIGRNVEILGGCDIPDNCIIGANTVTSGKFKEPNCIIAGNSGKVIRSNVIWAKDDQALNYNLYSECQDQKALKYITNNNAKEKMTITVIGVGSVGLSNAIILAQHNKVFAVDIAPEKVEMLNQHRFPISDKEIEKYLMKKKLDLTATMDAETVYGQSDFVIISTPTNYDDEKNFFDTSSVELSIEKVLHCNSNAIIIIKSTVPIGFTLEMQQKYNTKSIIYSPEFLREGKALYDKLYPSRIIIGAVDGNEGVTAAAQKFAELLQQGAIKQDIPKLFLKPTEAEAVKFFANRYIALSVSFFNELDSYADLNGLDTNKIIEGICLDPHIGYYYNNPSFVYGDYCLSIDKK